MASYNYTQWSAGVPPVAAPTVTAGNVAYAAYHAAYQAPQPIDHTQGYYQALAAGQYGQPPLASAAPYVPPVISTSSTPYVHPPAAPATPAAGQFGTQYPPSALGLHQSLQQRTPPPLIPPAPIGTKPTHPSPRGPFVSVSRSQGVPPALTRPSLLGRGGHAPRNPRPRPSGPGGPGSSRRGGPGARESKQFGGGSGFRNRGPRSLLDMDKPGEWGGPPPRWDGPPEDWNRPPGRWHGPNESWDGPPNGWDGGPPSRWNDRSGPADRWSRDSRGNRDRSNRERFGKRDPKPPPLMGPDYDVRRKDKMSRKRRRSGSSDRRSKRHVDEDLNVTIMAGRTGGEEIREGNKYFCTLCKVTIKKGYEFQQHLRGRRHKQRVAEQKAEGKDGESGSANPNDVIATDQDVTLDDTLTLMPLDDQDKIRLYCIICRLALLNELNKQAHDCTPSHLKRAKEIEEMQSKVEDDTTVCVNCVTPYEESKKEEHVKSESHKESLHWRMAACEICTCKFNDTTELEKHFQLPRHFKQYEKLKQTGLTAKEMTKYYEDVQAAISEKRMSFCLICTTACGNAENLEIHNIVAAKYHERMNRQAAKAGPTQFYCYCCQRVLEESDRRYHGKSLKHKMAKEEFRRWNCEDCNLTFDQERMLYPHLKCKAHITMVERRKAIQQYTINNFIIDWKRKQADANQRIQEQLSTLPKKGLRESESSQNNGIAEGVNTSVDSDLTVIPISGHFCTACNVFYQFDADSNDLCSHVNKAKSPRGEMIRGEGDEEVNEDTEETVNVKLEQSETELLKESELAEASGGNNAVKHVEARVKLEPAEEDPDGVDYAKEGNPDGANYVEEGDPDGVDYAEEGDPDGVDYAEEGNPDSANYVEEGDPDGADYVEEGDPDGADYAEEGDPDDADYAEEGNPDGADYVEEGDPDDADYAEEGDPDGADYAEEGDPDGADYTEEGDPDGLDYAEEGKPDDADYAEQGEADEMKGDDVLAIEIKLKVASSDGGCTVETHVGPHGGSS